MGAQAARMFGQHGQQWRLELGLFGHGAPSIIGVQQELLGKVAGERATITCTLGVMRERQSLVHFWSCAYRIRCQLHQKCNILSWLFQHRYLGFSIRSVFVFFVTV